MPKAMTVTEALADPSVRNLTKDTLRAALDKDALDAYRDVQLAADILKARFDSLCASSHSSSRPMPRTHREEETTIMDAAEREIIERLADYLEETHGDEMENDHYGDGPTGCTYCEAISDARTIAASHDAAEAGR